MVGGGGLIQGTPLKPRHNYRRVREVLGVLMIKKITDTPRADVRLIVVEILEGACLIFQTGKKYIRCRETGVTRHNGEKLSTLLEPLNTIVL